LLITIRIFAVISLFFQQKTHQQETNEPINLSTTRLQVAFYACLFQEGSYGRGSLVFTTIVALGSMIAPFMLIYTLVYFFKRAPTKREGIHGVILSLLPPMRDPLVV
jgi:ABC-type glycerol-3-phosphate transport system permease component